MLLALLSAKQSIKNLLSNIGIKGNKAADKAAKDTVQKRITNRTLRQHTFIEQKWRNHWNDQQ